MKTNMRKVTGTACLILMLSVVQAQDVTGSWEGSLEVQGQKIPLVFHIEQEGEELSATMDSPAQGAMGIPVDGVSLEGSKVIMTLAQAGIRYEGDVREDEISGTFYQSNMEFPLLLKKGGARQLPGDTSLVSSDEALKELAAYDSGSYQYTVADYFARPKARTFQFSPDGSYMSYREKDDNAKNHIYVKELATGKVKRVIEERDELIRGYGWANNNRLVYVMDQGGNENYQLYAINIDGSNPLSLTPFDGVQVSILEELKDDKDHMIISMNKNNPQVFEPYKINLNTGKLEQLYTNEDVANPINTYFFDKEGVLRGFVRLRDGVEQDLYYDKMDGNGYVLVKSLNWKDAFSPLSFDYQSDNPHDVYMISNLESDKAEIIRYDLKAGKVIEKLYSHDSFDMGGLSFSRHRGYEPDFYSYEGEKQVIVPLSKTFTKWHDRITKEFPGMQYSISDRTDDESKLLVFLQSDKVYGTYYSYDTKKDAFELLYDLMPQLRPEDMAEMRPITFKSRDGVTLHGYITLPKQALEGQKVPLIVNPHGGPQGIRDSWGFNPEAQLFASRGYATLQVNFRISGGYGKDFLESGFKQIGRKAMDDVEDGLQYVIEQGWVDKDRVAIYGGSHGGYAVLRGLTKTPDLYACGVDYVGVSNLFTFMKSIPPYWKPYLKIIKEIWYDEEVPEEKTVMEEVSPVFHIDKIKKPLLVVQGANDPRVNIDESDQIVRALRAKGVDVPYMVKYDEGHGFAKEENSIAMYEAMMGFYAKHLKKQEIPKPLKD